MNDEHPECPEEVLGEIPSGVFVLSTAFDGLRSGLLASWVQRCSLEPPMVMVAIPKGQAVEPLILNSRSFVLCRIRPDDRFVVRKFASAPERTEDPFVAISTKSAPSGGPIIDRAASFLDCQVIRHIELESDHRVYVGQVTTAGRLNGVQPGVNGHARSESPLDLEY
jgi:flavin reductase (DIM6/NTAB) family NADH-FMN oxidoreductase RutF